MGVCRRFELFLLILMIVAISKCPTSVEPSAIALQHSQRYSKVFATLGVVCDCCDGVEGDDKCISTWERPCSKLRCLPWKHD